MTEYMKADRTSSLNPVNIVVASLAGFVAGAHQAYLCSAIYDELSTLDDRTLEHRGIARNEIPRVAAAATGLLPCHGNSEAERARADMTYPASRRH
jgi:hypothetical protein